MSAMPGPLLDRLNELTRCDCTTRNVGKARDLARRMDELEARITELGEQEELGRLRPDLTGNQVMELLGVGPGPVVGRALAFLMELRLDEGPLSEDEADGAPPGMVGQPTGGGLNQSPKGRAS